MKVKDYSPIGHIDFFDGTRVPVVKETEVRCDVFKQVINFIAVDGEIYQYQKNAEKFSTTYVCKFFKFDHKNCWFEPTNDVKVVKIYCEDGSYIYTPTTEPSKPSTKIDYSEWVRTSPEPAPIWPNSRTLWVAADKYENLKKDFTIVCGALKRIRKMSTITFKNEPQTLTIDGHCYCDSMMLDMIIEALDIAEKEDTPDNTLRKLYYNIHNYHVLQKKYNELKDELTVAKDANYVIRKNCAELKKRNDILKDENNSLLEDVKEWDRRYKELDGRYKDLRVKCDAVRKERYELLQFKNKNWWIAEYAEQCPGSVSLIEADFKLKKANAALKEELRELRDRAKEYKNKHIEIVHKLHNEKDDLISQLKTSSGNIDVLLQERQHYINKSKRYAEALSIIDSNLGWSTRRDKDGAPYYYTFSLILAKDINKIRETMQEVKSENNN